MNFRIIFSIATIPFLLYCANSRQTVVKDDKNNQQVIEPLWNEEFDPMTLSDYALNVDKSKSSKIEIASVDQLLKGDTKLDSSKSKQQIPGFRVQLISTRNEEESRSILRNAVLSFSEQVYRVYDNPYYKVRVGDCTSRYEAEKLQQKAITAGFLGAWVVPTTVIIQPMTIKKSEQPIENK